MKIFYARSPFLSPRLSLNCTRTARALLVWLFGVVCIYNRRDAGAGVFLCCILSPQSAHSWPGALARQTNVLFATVSAADGFLYFVSTYTDSVSFLIQLYASIITKKRSYARLGLPHHNSPWIYSSSVPPAVCARFEKMTPGSGDNLLFCFKFLNWRGLSLRICCDCREIQRFCFSDSCENRNADLFAYLIMKLLFDFNASRIKIRTSFHALKLFRYFLICKLKISLLSPSQFYYYPQYWIYWPQDSQHI